MSAFPLTAAGAVRIDGATAIAQTYNGFGTTAAGKIATSAAAHAYWHNGSSFDTADRLRTVAEGTVADVHNGFGFDSTDRLVTTTTLPTTPPHSGLLFDSTCPGSCGLKGAGPRRPHLTDTREHRPGARQ